MGPRAVPILVAAVALATAAAGCGQSHHADWVASEVYVIDDRASCMSVTARDDGRRLSVCRDDRGAVTCRLTPDPASVVSGADCDAATHAVLDWESGDFSAAEDDA
jgi:hypothetical protein